MPDSNLERGASKALHLSLKFSSTENVLKRDATLAPVAKQWIAKDNPSYGSESKRAKIAIHWFGKYKGSILWSTVSNALERSRKTRIVYSLLSTTLDIFETSSRIENLLTGFSWTRIDCLLRFYAYLEKTELACALIFPFFFFKHGRTDIGL